MNSILKNIDFIARSPGGVALLRKLVLEFAVRGKLVSQDPKDEPASALLERLMREKVQQEKEEKTKPGKALPEIKEEETPYGLPKGWRWVRLGNITSAITKGSTPTTYGYNFVPSGINFIKVENIEKNQVIADSITQFITPEAHSFFKRSQLEDGDILFSIAGTIGEICKVGPDILPANINQALAIIRGTSSVFLQDYLIICLNSFISDQVNNRARGGAMYNVSLGDLKELSLPLPPISEQFRIVARVQELMAVLDRLEGQTNRTEDKRNRALIAATQAISQATASKEIASSWQRLAADLARLVDRAEDVKTIRAMVLELAVRGKLVSQDPKDEPASVLLERIKREKVRLAKEEKIKAAKELPEIKQEEKPFKLPNGWVWVRLGEISSYIQRGKGPDYVNESPIRVINQKCIRWEGIDLRYAKYISEESFALYDSERILQNEDILWNSTGTGTIGRACVVRDVISNQLVCDSHVTVVRLSLINSCYLASWLRSAFIYGNIESTANGSTNQIELATSTVISTVVPLPPLPEQSRIVARVQELMAILDQLEEKLSARDKAATLASESIVKKNKA